MYYRRNKILFVQDNSQYFDKVYFQIEIEIKASTKENYIYNRKVEKLCNNL